MTICFCERWPEISRRSDASCRYWCAVGDTRRSRGHGRLLGETGATPPSNDRGIRPRPQSVSTLRLSLAGRETISRGLLTGACCRQIAARLTADYPANSELRVSHETFNQYLP